jgi:hypothetical protein
MPKLHLPHNMTLTLDAQDDLGAISDGFHSFDELYRHRHLLFCHLIAHDPQGWKSWLHADGTGLPGWFLAGTTIWCTYPATGGEAPTTAYSLMEAITYHLPTHYWDLCHVKEQGHAPAWDGHTSADVCDRLERALREER